MTFIIIIIIIVILAKVFGSPVSKKNSQAFNKPLQKNSASRPKVTVKINSSGSNQTGSIIEVTGQSFKINSNNSQTQKLNTRVPYWHHQYVYSYSEINVASPDQKAFYRLFKAAFLKGQYVDLEGNLNYAFILFFDVLDEFEKHKDINKIEKQLEILGNFYPKTAGYAIPELVKRLEVMGDQVTLTRLIEKEQARYSTVYESHKLGSKFKSSLKLSNQEVTLLNRIWQPSNNFGGIEHCCKQIVSLFLGTIRELEKRAKEENSNLDDQLNYISDLVARKHFGYRSNSTNYKYSIDQTKDQVYSTIFKYCENCIRDIYAHKRKLSIDFYDNNLSIQQEFVTRIVSKLEMEIKF